MGQGETGRGGGNTQGIKLNQEQNHRDTSARGRFSLCVEMGFGSSCALAEAGEGAGTGRAGAGTDLSEENMHLLWRPLGAAVAQSRIIHSSHSFRSLPAHH